MRVLIGFLVRGRVRIKIRIRVRVRVRVGVTSTLGFTAGAIVAGANVRHSKFQFLLYRKLINIQLCSSQNEIHSLKIL